jgi:hypothetical protein
MKTISIKCAVAATNSGGEPDFYFAKVECTPTAYNEGQHYDAIKSRAVDEGYEGPMVAFDELDWAGKALMGLFAWDSADTVEYLPNTLLWKK